MPDLASGCGTVFVEGDGRPALSLFTAAEEPYMAALPAFETVVCYKGGSRLGEVLRVAGEEGRLEDAVYGARLGIDGEEVAPAREMVGRGGTYLSTVVFTGRGSGLG